MECVRWEGKLVEEIVRWKWRVRWSGFLVGELVENEEIKRRKTQLGEGSLSKSSKKKRRVKGASQGEFDSKKKKKKENTESEVAPGGRKRKELPSGSSIPNHWVAAIRAFLLQVHKVI